MSMVSSSPAPAPPRSSAGRTGPADRGNTGTGGGAGAPDVLARVERLKPLLRRNAARGDADRRLPDESVTALAEAGAFKLTVPRPFGGYEAPVRDLLDVYAAIAEADGAAAWVTMVLNSGAFSAGLYPKEVQEEVFGADPDARVSPVVAATGQGRRVPGGWRISHGSCSS